MDRRQVQPGREVLDWEDLPDRPQRGTEVLGGINTPDRNQSGIVVACTIGWAASGEPIIPDTA